MTKTILILTAVLFLTGCASTRQIHESTYISFPDKFGVLQNCNGQTITETITLTTNSKEPVLVFETGGSPKYFNITHNNMTLTPKDTLIFSEKEPIVLKVTLTIDSEAKYYHYTMSFKTNHPKHEREVIEFIPQTLMLTAKQIQEGGQIVIDKTDNCLDSLSIIFPYGGTITTVNLFKADTDSLNQKKPDKTISYMMFENNKMDFSPLDTGEYFVDYSSCHWGNDLKIKIK